MGEVVVSCLSLKTGEEGGGTRRGQGSEMEHDVIWSPHREGEFEDDAARFPVVRFRGLTIPRRIAPRTA